ncbi:hypothetical protein DSL72_003822 [Monilinia vaccinii-corymbosi]|uniref:DUF7492 domain-containing protein n=1 Tax=Monilinia vaccinii-corymbosi TaxID=61207 RepID=A0A8A3P8A2_9HELO|nr:hypothetical protein DSL72_003822 [Monilinia vaccinii-corymbosi]
MKSMISISIAAFALLFQTTVAHTWADELRVIARNGTFTSTGYPRGYVPRVNVPPTAPIVGTLDDNLWELQNIIPDDTPICSPKQTPGAYPNPVFPALSAAPGDFVAIRYQENGHVTEPTQAAEGNKVKGFGSGLVYVYGTADSKSTDKYNSIHKVWNKDGTGGDKRGKLLAVQYFDDMACFLAGNTNGDLFVDSPKNVTTLAMAREAAYKRNTTDPLQGANIWCQTDFQIPAEAQANKDYSIYWVWDWPTMDKTTGQQTLNQSYTICADIAVTGPVNNDPIAYVAPQDLAGAAQWSQMLNAFVVDPTAAQEPWALRVTTDLFARPTKNGFAGTSTSYVQPTTASSITQQNSTSIQNTSTTQQAPTATSSTQQAPTATSSTIQQSFVTVTVTVTQTSGVVEPACPSNSMNAGLGAASSVAAPASGYPLSIAPFMKRSIQIHGRDVN